MTCILITWAPAGGCNKETLHHPGSEKKNILGNIFSIKSLFKFLFKLYASRLVSKFVYHLGNEFSVVSIFSCEHRGCTIINYFLLIISIVYECRCRCYSNIY